MRWLAVSGCWLDYFVNDVYYRGFMSIDLHVHSTFSDGSMTPAALVALARRKGLVAISITDHDNMESVPGALAAGFDEGIEVLPGFELSVTHGDISMHLLGYMFDPDNLKLQGFLSQIQDGRKQRNRQIVEKLNTLNLGIEKELGDLLAQRTQVGRPHIARILVKKKLVKNSNEAFKKYLVPGGLAYVKRPVSQVADAIEVIRDAGGISSLAHPLNIRGDNAALTLLVDELAGIGLDGIEAYYPTHSKKMQRFLVEYAGEKGLICTGGSDYHGDFRPGTYLAGGKNVSVPVDVLVAMKKRYESVTIKK